MGNITRSTGIPAEANGVTYGMAGGGYEGATPELDQVVQEGARALADAYGMDVTIRFNSDRESGGAFLVTHERDGICANAEVGICASVITEHARARWAGMAERYPEEDWAEALRDCPAGMVTVRAYIAATSALPEHLMELRTFPGWNGRGKDGYHSGEAASVALALERCLQFAPPSAVLRVGKG